MIYIKGENMKIRDSLNEKNLFEYIKNFAQGEEDIKKYNEMEFAISTILTEYLKLQDKPFYSEYKAMKSSYFHFDGFAPKGFDNYKGVTVFQYKFYKDTSPFNLYKMASKFILKLENIFIDNIIFIIPNVDKNDMEKIKKEIESNYNINVDIWNVDNLINIYKKVKESKINFDDFFDNLYEYYLYSKINKSTETTKSDRREKHKNKLNDLKNIYTNESLVLFLGAGVSADANIPTWDDLISKLFMELMNSLIYKNEIRLDEKEKFIIENSVKRESDFSPIIKTRLLKTGFMGELEEQLKDLMYVPGEQCNTKLISSISKLCSKKVNNIGIKSIVTYNFDDLLEQSLKANNIKHQSIYSESLMPVNHALGIYHVHGFIPRDKGNYISLENSMLVFSEEEYHKIMLDPYNWTNLVQLDYLSNDTCVFIGLSLTDPNLRRLLDIAFHKRFGRYNSSFHYAFLKKPELDKIKLSKDGEEFKKINMDLLESFYKELGILIIWIDEYSDLPKMLDYISADNEII